MERFPGPLKALLIDIKRKRKIVFSRKSVLSAIDSITLAMDRRMLTGKEFTFLEDLRLCLIDYKKGLFGK